MQKLLRFVRIIKSLFLCNRSGGSKTIYGSSVVLQCDMADRYLKMDGKNYSPFLDRVYSEKGFDGYNLLSIPKIYDFNSSSDFYGNVSYPFVFYTKLFHFVLIAFRLKKAANKLLVKNYKTYLEKNNCVMVLGIQPDRALVVAANNLDLRVVDLLHGYGINSNHKIYGYEAFKNKELSELCTDYITLDLASKRVLENSVLRSNKKITISSVRSPLFNHKKYTLPSFCSENYSRVVLVTLQWGIERFEMKYPHADGDLHPRIKETINTCKDCFFIVKPHPVLLKNRKAIEKLKNNLTSICNAQLVANMDIFSLLNVSQFHLTIWSSSTREASMKGIPSLIFSSDDYLFEGTNLFKEELDEKIALRVADKSIADIASLIRNYTVPSELLIRYQMKVQPKNLSIAHALMLG